LWLVNTWRGDSWHTAISTFVCYSQNSFCPLSPHSSSTCHCIPCKSLYTSLLLLTSFYSCHTCFCIFSPAPLFYLTCLCIVGILYITCHGYSPSLRIFLLPLFLLPYSSHRLWLTLCKSLFPSIQSIFFLYTSQVIPYLLLSAPAYATFSQFSPAMLLPLLATPTFLDTST